MPKYDEWNSAIAADVCERALESLVYLDTTEERIEEIGRSRFSLASGAVDDLLAAVRSKVVDRHGRVTLGAIVARTRRSLLSLDEAAPPPSVAFLAVTVLAASRMGEGYEGNNYFLPLRDLLQCRVGDQGNRPDGMQLDHAFKSPLNAPEFSLWRDWGQWLDRKDLLATYRLGEHANKFTKLPQSQILLRTVDRERLLDIFREGRFPRYLNEYEVIQRLQNEIHWGLNTTVQIKDILSDDNRRRLVGPYIKDLHEQFLDGLQSDIVRARLQRIVRAGAKITYIIQDDGFGQGPVAVTPEILQDGWSNVLPDGRQLKLRPRLAWALSQESRLGPFISVTQTRANEPLLLLASRDAYATLLSMEGSIPITWEDAPEREVMPGWVERACQVRVGEWPGEWEYLAPVGGIGLTFTRRVSIGGPYRWLRGRLASLTVAMSSALRRRAVGRPRVSVERLASGGIMRIPNTKLELRTHSDEYSLGELDPGMWLVRAEVDTHEGFPERVSQRIEIISRDELGNGTREAIQIQINGINIQGLRIE